MPEEHTTSASTGIAGTFGAAATFLRITNNSLVISLSKLSMPYKFEQEVLSVGVNDFNQCCILLARYMPEVIRQFIACVGPL
ncbi:hypothetical protein INT47_007412 [Mucor saturninus]|uniref:Uncharacterized protein n=1 Tax=Mucor saturninus TaxID=64648 RepID=A0A8H7R0A0_9FUNG|nr:hypothetical protein INT47_007412 [Mucor saturninus]